MAITYLPFEPKSADNFTTELEGIGWQIYYRWNYTESAWYMDLSSVQTGDTVRGIKMVPGINILQPFALTELGWMYVVDTEGKEANPDYDGWGDRYKVLYIPKEDIV